MLKESALHRVVGYPASGDNVGKVFSQREGWFDSRDRSALTERGIPLQGCRAAMRNLYEDLIAEAQKELDPDLARRFVEDQLIHPHPHYAKEWMLSENAINLMERMHHSEQRWITLNQKAMKSVGFDMKPSLVPAACERWRNQIYQRRTIMEGMTPHDANAELAQISRLHRDSRGNEFWQTASAGLLSFREFVLNEREFIPAGSSAYWRAAGISGEPSTIASRMRQFVQSRVSQKINDGLNADQAAFETTSKEGRFNGFRYNPTWEIHASMVEKFCAFQPAQWFTTENRNAVFDCFGSRLSSKIFHSHIAILQAEFEEQGLATYSLQHLWRPTLTHFGNPCWEITAEGAEVLKNRFPNVFDLTSKKVVQEQGEIPSLTPGYFQTRRAEEILKKNSAVSQRS